MSLRVAGVPAMCAVLLATACTAAPTRNYIVRGPDAFYGVTQAASAREWMQRRGIYDQVYWNPETVSFKFGSDDLRTLDYTTFETFVRERLSGYTVANAQRTDMTSADGSVPRAVIYFGADGQFAQWSGAIVARGQWWIENMPDGEQAKARQLGADPPLRVVCFQREGGAPPDKVPVGLPSCSSAYEQLIAMHGKRVGDVFDLMSGNVPGRMTREYPMTWPDGQPLFPERAPHD